jgi:hypothetical protein
MPYGREGVFGSKEPLQDLSAGDLGVEQGEATEHSSAELCQHVTRSGTVASNVSKMNFATLFTGQSQFFMMD